MMEVLCDKATTNVCSDIKGKHVSLSAELKKVVTYFCAGQVDDLDLHRTQNTRHSSGRARDARTPFSLSVVKYV